MGLITCKVERLIVHTPCVSFDSGQPLATWIRIPLQPTKIHIVLPIWYTETKE